ncbi:MAG: beta-lactamase family protein, partial [Planctomycetes bacterium]|nr:beta-lactamase family protein [Planctomycetota bacterium]
MRIVHIVSRVVCVAACTLGWTSAVCAKDPAAGLAQIAPRLQEFVAAKQISGAVTLVVHRGQIVHHAAVGEADRSTHRPMAKDSVFAIASMTKPITATALMILVDEGKLSISDPVSKYIPAFADARLATGKPAREITVRDLLTHTSGLTGDQGVKEGSLEKTVQEMATRTLAFEPGSKWSYSPGLTVCGRIIEVVSGMPFQDFLARRIFEPLKMRETSFAPTAEQQARLALLYKPSADKQEIEPAVPQLVGTGAPTFGPSGGLFSTASDMAR